MAGITELSESRRESEVGKSEDEDEPDLNVLACRRPSRIDSDDCPTDEIDDGPSEDDHNG